jgi:hypothetical protein
MRLIRSRFTGRNDSIITENVSKTVAAGFMPAFADAPMSRVGRDAAVVGGNGAATEQVAGSTTKRLGGSSDRSRESFSDLALQAL